MMILFSREQGFECQKGIEIEGKGKLQCNLLHGLLHHYQVLSILVWIEDLISSDQV